MNKFYRVIWNRTADRFVVPLLFALVFPAVAMAQAQIADGTTLVVAPGGYDTTGTGEGVLVSRNGGDLQANDVTVNSTGNNAPAANAQSSGTVTLTNSDLSTQGTGSTGVLANGVNGTNTEVKISDSQVTTHGDNAVGMAAIDSDSRITAEHVTVTTEGAHSAGVVSGGVTGDGSSAPVITLTDSTVSTSGNQAFGVIAQGDGRVGLTDSAVTTTGNGSTGVVVRAGSSATLDYSTISTSGTGANGVSVINDPGHYDHTKLDMTGGSITTHGDLSTGLKVNNGNLAQLDGVNIDTTGQDASGVVATGTSATGVHSSVYLTDGSVNTSGDRSSAIVSQDGGSVFATNTTLTTTGDSASAAQVSGGTLSLDGGKLTSAQGSAIEVNATPGDPTTINLSNGARASGGNDVFVQVNDENAAVNLSLDHRARAIGDINGADSNGDGQITATTDLTLQQLSSWQGSTNGAVDQLSLDAGSEWTLTGDSTVGQLTLDHSAVVFARPTEGDYKTLTVTGDFSSDGGVLFMNSELEGDDSGTDMLHVEGDTSGQAYVHVNNVGGTGAPTTDGIELIQVDGQSDAQFSLAGRAVGGTNEYYLYQGSYSDPNDGDWYLRSQLSTDPSDPTTPTDPSDPTAPTNPGTPLTPAVPVYRPEVGSYLSNQSAAVNMFQLSMHDRLGTPELDPQRISDERLGSLWVRVNRNAADYTGGKNQLDVDSDTSVLQIGTDLVHWGESGRGLMGVMVGTGTNKNTTRSDLTGYSSEGEVDGTAVGVYGTWFADPTGATGLYLDSWLQYGRYDNSVHGEGLDEENYDAHTLAGSLEAGYSWNVFANETSRIYVQPQVQVTATHYDSDDHQETNGTEVKSDEAGGVTTRTGVRVYGQVGLDNGVKVQPFTTVNWYHNSQDNAVAFNDSVMQGGDPKNRYELKTGAQLVLGKHWSTWGQVGVQSGEDDYRDVSAQVGLKYNF